MWMPGANGPLPNEWHWLRSPATHAGHNGVTPAGDARQPRVERDAVPRLEAFGLGADGDDVGDHLVAQHVG